MVMGCHHIIQKIDCNTICDITYSQIRKFSALTTKNTFLA